MNELNHFNQSFAAWLAIVVTIVMGGLLWYISTREHNKGKEIGKVLLELQMKYPISAFYIFLILLNFAEAYLAMAIIDDQVNPVARMITHVTIALISISAGIVWTKEVMNLWNAFKKPISAKNIFLSSGLVFITTAFSLGLPIVNLFILANGFNQSVQLAIFWKWLWSFSDKTGYFQMLADYGLPLTYSPWQAMSPVMCASFLVTIVHIGIVFWESFKAARINDTHMQAALNNDLEDKTAPPKKDGDKKDEKDSKDDKKDDKPKDDLPSFERLIKQMLEYAGADDDEVTSKVDKAKKMKTSLTIDQQNTIGKHLADLRLAIDKLDNRKKEKTITDSDYERDKAALVEQIKTQLKKGPSHGGLGMEMKKK
jgi:hypothetical protein